MPGPLLESMESESLADSADEKLLGGIHNVIYKATSLAFQKYQNILDKYEKQQKPDLSSRCEPKSHLYTPR
jgi:hypothetical protein